MALTETGAQVSTSKRSVPAGWVTVAVVNKGSGSASVALASHGHKTGVEADRRGQGGHMDRPRGQGLLHALELSRRQGWACVQRERRFLHLVDHVEQLGVGRLRVLTSPGRVPVSAPEGCGSLPPRDALTRDVKVT